ncbi:MAG: lipoate--protein ligase [Lentihominibacter sp.]
MNKLIYIENTSTDPHYNLAFEEYVFTQVAGDTPILLLWQNGPSVIVGRYQNTLEEINYDFIRENGVNVVRRNTGGGAVYHDLGNLNYSFVIPGVASRVDFKTFTTPIVKALQSQGIAAEQTGRNDILVDGFKFSGNAQQFSDGKLLHHGTLMFDVNIGDVANVLRVKPGKFKSKASKSVRSRITNLKPFFRGDTVPDTLAFKALLLEWFRREYPVEDLTLTKTQLKEIEALKDSKYATHTWNYGKSPKADIIRGDFFACGQVEFHFRIEDHKVKSLELTGDFFPSGDIEEFEAMFVGVDYDREALLEVLQRADLSKYLGNVTAEELADVIV